MNDTENESSSPKDTPQDSLPPFLRRNNGEAKWSLNFGLLAWLLPGIIGIWVTYGDPLWHSSGMIWDGILCSVPLWALLAVFLGHISNWRSCHPTKSHRDKRAIAGLALGYLMLVFLACTAVFLLLWARERGPRTWCEYRLCGVGSSLKMYASTNDEGFLPELMPELGVLAILNKPRLVFPPEGRGDTSCLFCPGKKGQEEYKKWKDDPDPQTAFNHSSYLYLGYAMKGDAEVEAFAEAYRQRLAKGLPFNEDLPVPPGKGNNGGNTIHRLRHGVEKIWVTDDSNSAAGAQVQSEIPVLIERLGNHWFRRCHIVFLDGHVDVRKFPGDWPMTEKTMAALQSVETLRD